MNFFRVDPKLGLKIDGKPLHHVSNWQGYAIFSSILGNTGCCGSGEFWTSSGLDSKLVHFLLKYAKVSIMLIHYWQSCWFPPVNAVVLGSNVGVKGVFSVKCTKIKDGEMLVLLDILDVDEYNKWMGQ